MINQIKEQALKNKSKYLRDGQQIFNYVQGTYGIGFLIRDKYNIDCFYVDSKIDDFLNKVIEELESTKIVCISDLHGYLPRYLPEGHILVIAGDIAPTNIDRDFLKSTVWWVSKFLPWLDTLDYEKVILIPGNHDFLSEFCHKEGKPFLDIIDPEHNYNLVYLINESFSYRGINFYGTPNVRYLKNWAFYENDDALKYTFSNIPPNTDFLITHQPPQIGNCGVILEHVPYTDCGSPELAEAVSKIPNIKYSVFGHIHSGDHNCTINENGTKFYNVSLKDERYIVKYEPLVIEYGKEVIKK
jgi:Icc-related predicted phosphoesterase